MSKIKEIYYRNIYGVIATLSIHLIIVAFLFMSQIRPLVKIPEETIFVDFNTEIVPEKTQEEQQQEQESRMSSVEQGVSQGQNASNIAFNEAFKEGTFARNPSNNQALDDEIRAAQQLVSDVSRNLSQKIPDIGDVAMPEETTEGMTREQVQQSDFKGKHNIRYNVPNRYHLRLPIPVYLAQGGGEVTVDIVVNRNGNVISAVPRSNPAIKDLTILAYAKQAAEKTEFNSDPSAPEKQRGTISYTFVAQ